MSLTPGTRLGPPSSRARRFVTKPMSISLKPRTSFSTIMTCRRSRFSRPFVVLDHQELHVRTPHYPI